MSLGPADLAASAAAGVDAGRDVENKQRIDALTRSLNAGDTKDKKLKEACRGFEAVFIQQLFTQMRATVPKSGLLHSQYEDQYMSMFDQSLSDKLAADGGIGLADMMYRQLKSKVAGKGDAGQTGGTVPPTLKPASAVAFGSLPLPPVKDKPAGRAILYDHLPPVGAGILPKGPQASPAPEGFQDPLASAPAPADAAKAQALIEMAAPAVGNITSEYGWRADPFTGKKAWHAGMDIAAAEGSPVASCWDGQVVFAGAKAGYGNTVVVEHPGGWKSIYGHLSRITVKEGDTVASGGKIAEVGSTGRSTGSHLHFELRRNEAAVDPEPILAAAGLAPADEKKS